jgi:hypothetical protein
VASSGRKSLSLKAQPSDRKPEENPPAKKTEKEQKKRFGLNVGKKTEREEDNNFKSAFSPRFQLGPVRLMHVPAKRTRNDNETALNSGPVFMSLKVCSANRIRTVHPQPTPVPPSLVRPSFLIGQIVNPCPVQAQPP